MSAAVSRPRARARAALLACALLAAAGRPALASSHSDAPLAGQDPQVDLTDVYAFVGTRYDDPASHVLNVLVQVRPFSDPRGGGVRERFADDVLYSIHVADPASGETLARYDFRFSDVDPETLPGLKNPDTILSYGQGAELGAILAPGDAHQNYSQVFAVQRSEGRKRKPVTLAEGLATPPPNLGPRTTPAYNDSGSGQAISGATQFAELDVYTQQAIHPLASGEVAFAGLREDGFYADLAGLFDLLHPRLLQPDGFGQSGGGPDALANLDALVYALQIPLAELPSLPYTDVFGTASNGVGVYASLSRGSRKLKRSGVQVSKKPRVQVARMGNPLLGLLFLPLGHKAEFARSSPPDDAGFTEALLAPELARLLNLVFGFGFAESGRDDLRALFLPDVLRVDTSAGPVRLPGQAGFSRLSGFGGDTTPLGGHPGGWPNGRRPGDDVVDIALTALASGPSFAIVTILGDNVAANDQLYHQVFPYLGTPHSGTNP